MRLLVTGRLGEIQTTLSGFSLQWTQGRGVKQLYAAHSGGIITEERLGRPDFFRPRTSHGRLDRHEFNNELRWTEEHGR